jgi:hypothetical protein
MGDGSTVILHRQARSVTPTEWPSSEFQARENLPIHSRADMAGLGMLQ